MCAFMLAVQTIAMTENNPAAKKRRAIISFLVIVLVVWGYYLRLVINKIQIEVGQIPDPK